MITKALMKERIEGSRYCWLSLDQVREMKEAVDNIVIWHKYPEEKPKKTPYPRVLLVTYYEEFDLERFIHVATDLFDGGFKEIPDADVLAWAEMPKPYEEDRAE